MKKSIIFISLIILSFNLCAQQSMYKSRFSLQAGSSYLGLLVNTIKASNYEMLNKCFATPVGQITYEYFVDEKVSIGVGATYQYFQFNFTLPDPSIDAVDINLHRVNIGARGMFHYLNNDVIHLYSGARLGMTAWILNARSKALNDFLMLLPVRLPINPEIKTIGTFISAQIVLFGMDIFVTKNLGINGELCIGPTYSVAGGFSFRF
jgi:hypothetical protein